MKPRAATVLVALVAVALLTRFPGLANAQAPPSLLTDQPFYTLRDKLVTLQGAGYNASLAYAVWLQGPHDNSTRNAGVSFTTTDRGEIPTAVSLPIESNFPLGTYLVSISNSSDVDTSVAQAHYGIWGSDKFVYQRTEIVQAKGGGVLPKTGLKVTIENPAGNRVYNATVAASETGTFSATWKIPPDAVTESYTILIHGIGTYDLPDKEFVSLSKFSVTPALLNVTVVTQPSSSYERTRTVSTEFAIRYPDASAVVSMKEGLKPVALYAGQFKIADLGVVASSTASGVWTAQFNIPRNASLDLSYKFVLPAGAFDDGYRNTGSEKDIETGSFGVTPATLQANLILNSTHYQVPFEMMTAYARISYPDGTLVSNTTVSAWLIAAGSRLNATVNYDREAAMWIAKYPFSLVDLFRPGSWTLSVTAKDIYANSGSASVEIVTEPYFFLEMLIAAIVAVLVARWLLLRFWRRLYLRGKRVIAGLRSRLKPVSLGRYLSDSPVTP